MWPSSEGKVTLSARDPSAGILLGDPARPLRARLFRGFRCDCLPVLFWSGWAGLCGLPRGARGEAVTCGVDIEDIVCEDSECELGYLEGRRRTLFVREAEVG
jgi:hypothetical protein